MQEHNEKNAEQSAYEMSYELYEAMRSGDTATLSAMQPKISENINRNLSKSAIRNAKYNFVIAASLAARCCVEGGMHTTRAYKMCDYYIAACDECVSEAQVNRLYGEMLYDFTARMRHVVKDMVYSRHISASLDYIRKNICRKLSVNAIAEQLGVTASYFSREFSREVGIPPNEYIMKKRIEAAENMLKFSDYSSTDIANYLAFCSHSHFISTFKRFVGVTPRQYRDKCYLREWRK